MKKVIAIIVVCAALFILGCSSNESMSGANEPQIQAEQEQPEQSAAPTETPMPTVRPTATPTPSVKPSPTPAQDKDTNDAGGDQAGAGQSTGSAQGGGQSGAGSSGSSGNTGGSGSGNSKEIAAHADINDDAQTVGVGVEILTDEPTTGQGTGAKTGRDGLPIWLLIVAIGAVATATLLVTRKKVISKRNQKAADNK